MKKGQVPISAALARSYISKIAKTYAAKISEPLPLLCDPGLGILRCVRPGVCAHIKAPAVYRLGDDFQKVFELRVALSPKLASKRENAEQRCQKGLDRKYPYREQLQKDLSSIVDALICQEENHAAVCEALGRHIFLAAGVCAKIGGICYSPLTEEEDYLKVCCRSEQRESTTD